MEKYKISLIVPVYNTENYLKRCVDSLLHQTYKNLEIILVDDGSTDQSGKICDKYERENEAVRVIHKENGGLVSAWKCGVGESIGEYLCFVDSDDWVEVQMLGGMAEHLTGSRGEIISSDYVIEYTSGNSREVYQQLQPGEYTQKVLKEHVLQTLLGQEKRPVCLSRCMKLISRELIVQNLKYSDPSIRMGEDVTIMLPALIDSERLVIMDHKIYYHYFYADDSMVHGYDPGLYQNIRHLREIIEKILVNKLEGTNLEKMKEGAQREYLLLLLLVLKNEARGNREGYHRNILYISRSKEVKDLIRSIKIQVSEKSNQLLYLVLRHPNHLTVSLLRAAMIVYYGRR